MLHGHTSPEYSLKRDITRPGLLFIAVSAMVGSGWLFGPLYAAQLAGPAAILSWLLGGILVLFCVFCFAELATMLPLAGGLSRFPHLTHGTTVGFTMSWLNWLAYVMVPPVEIQALLQYSGHYWPSLIQQYAGHDHGTHTNGLSPWGILVAMFLLISLAVANCAGVKRISKLNNVLCTIKLTVPVLAVCVLLSQHCEIQNLTSHGFMPYGWHGVLAALPAAGIVFSFFGFNLAISLAGEVQNPQKSMFFALIGSLGLCTVLYACIQAGFLLALPADTLQNGWAALQFAGSSGPFVGLATLLGLLPLAVLLYADAFLSPMGTSLIATLSNARSLMGMSLAGYFPANLQRIAANGSPVRAIVCNLVLGMTLLLPFPSWQQLAGFIIAALVLSHAMAPLSLVALRQQLPHHPRPFFLPYGQFMAFLSFFILNLITYWGGWHTFTLMLLTLSAGYGILLLQYASQRLLKTGDRLESLDLRHGWWLVPYLLGMAACSYAGNFGGGQEWLAEGWDALAILLVSIVGFFGAKHAACSPQHVQHTLKKTELLDGF